MYVRLRQPALEPGQAGKPDALIARLFEDRDLIAFRLRTRDGSAPWDGGSFRSPHGGGLYTFGRGEVVFSPQRRRVYLEMTGYAQPLRL